MATNEDHFITHWRVDGTCREVSDVIGDAESLVRWWPSVYLDVKVLDPGGPGGVGKRVDLFTKGWLPYTLRWQFLVTTSREPYGFELEASGDFDGRGIWTFRQDGTQTAIDYDWRIRADKPLLRTLSFLFKPVFAANHRWAMERGLESLRLELRRRRSPTAAERAGIPAPPGPTFRPRRA
jgi:hypothetical protein